jgi:hypothetical protein
MSDESVKRRRFKKKPNLKKSDISDIVPDPVQNYANKSHREIILDRLFSIACGTLNASDSGILKAIELYCKYSGEFEHANLTDEQLVVIVGDLNKLDTSNLEGMPDDWES